MRNKTPFIANNKFKDGRKANHGEPNPFKWDWEKANFTIGAGASGGGFNAYGGIGWNNNYGFAVGYTGRDVTIGYISNGKPVLAPVKDRVSEKWNEINKNNDQTLKNIKPSVINKIDEISTSWKDLNISSLSNGIGLTTDLYFLNISNKDVIFANLSWTSISLNIMDFSNDFYLWSKDEKSNLNFVHDGVLSTTLIFINPIYGLPLSFIDYTYTKGGKYLLEQYNYWESYWKEIYRNPYLLYY